MTPQQAYEEDCRRFPNYYDGTPRKKWQQLPDYVQQTWVENPTPREPITTHKTKSPACSNTRGRLDGKGTQPPKQPPR